MKEPSRGYTTTAHLATNSPLVSVIVPVYNVAPYLREALDSAVHQTYHNIEIILVDDGSTDGSGSICDEYCSDSRVQVIHQENRGVSNARNVGLDRAAGDFIAFLDSDDAYHPEFVQRMLDKAESADIVICQYMNYQLSFNSKGQAAILAKEGIYDRTKALQELLCGKINVEVCNKLYRKELWNQVRFPENLVCAEDRSVCYRIFDLCNHVYYLEKPLYFRRIRPGSCTQTPSRKKAENSIEVREQIITFVEKHIPEVYSEKHLRMAKQSALMRIISAYLDGYMELLEIQAACKNIDPEELAFRVKTAYHMIRICPLLLKLIYPVYRFFRSVVRKVLKR